VSLTRAGLAFLPLAQDILDRAEEAVRAARNSERDDHGIVRVGFAGAMGAPAVADISRLIRRRHPGIELRFLAHLGSAQVMDLLTTDALDIGFTAGQRTVHGLSSRVVADDGLGVVVALDHPLAQAPAVTLASLAEEPFVFVDAANGLRLREEAIEACIDVGFRPRIIQEAPDTATVFALAAAGVGTTIATEPFARSFPGTAFVPLTDVRRRLRTSVVWRDDAGFGALRLVLAAIDETFDVL
jgi:DNA-binding transcriptional LysR family regulator